MKFRELAGHMYMVYKILRITKWGSVFRQRPRDSRMSNLPRRTCLWIMRPRRRCPCPCSKLWARCALQQSSCVRFAIGTDSTNNKIQLQTLFPSLLSHSLDRDRKAKHMPHMSHGPLPHRSLRARDKSRRRRHLSRLKRYHWASR